MVASDNIVRGVVGVCVIAAIMALGAGPSPSAAEDAGERAAGDNNDFTTAMALLRAGDIDAALPRFERAAAAEPNVFDHQLALATVYLRKQRGPEGWRHLRKAVRIDPSNAQSAGMFNEIWRRFDKRGVFNAGHPIDGVRKIVGDPDRVHGNADAAKGVVRFEYGFMALDFVDGRMFTVIDLRGLTRGAIRPDETIEPALDGRKWRLGHRTVSANSVISEFVLPGESVQVYTEMASVRRHPGLARRGVSAEAFAANMAAHLDKSTRGAKFNILRRSRAEVIYEFIVPEGSNQPAQHEVARLVVGETDIHAVAYVKLGAPMPEAERDAWAKRLSGAKLIQKQVTAAGE